tara:strand:- start:385 stop:1422 length:1038 start_codon:yes stop_codon:yes gene_type:complete
MGYMTSPPALADIDGDGDIDGVLRRIKDGTGISLSLSQNILTIDTSGGVAQFSDGVPSNSNGENNDVNIDYTNGNIYRKVAGSWSLFEQIPSVGRIGRFVANYSPSSFAAGNFAVNSGKFYFHNASFPGCSSVANAEAYLASVGYTVGTRFIFQQLDDLDNIAVYRATESTIYTDGDSGYESGVVGANHVGLVLTKESGGTFSNGNKFTVAITVPLNFLFDSSGNATISADLTIKEVILTTASGSTDSTATTTIDEWPIATYRSAKYEYHITDTSASPREYQTGEAMVIHDGTNSKHNSYGVIFTGTAALGTFSTDVSSGNCRLRFTAANSNSMTIKVARKAIKV